MTKKKPSVPLLFLTNDWKKPRFTKKNASKVGKRNIKMYFRVIFVANFGDFVCCPAEVCTIENSKRDYFIKTNRNKLMMYNWFECKVKYEKTLDDGSVKKVNEPYLVDAVNFTEAERRITLEMQPLIKGEFEVADIKRVRYSELFETALESADRWFKAKLIFITLDEKSGKERKSSQQVLIQAADLPAAIERLQEGMKESMLDYTIANIAETQLMDVYHYQEPVPENSKKA